MIPLPDHSTRRQIDQRVSHDSAYFQSARCPFASNVQHLQPKVIWHKSSDPATVRVTESAFGQQTRDKSLALHQLHHSFAHGLTNVHVGFGIPAVMTS